MRLTMAKRSKVERARRSIRVAVTTSPEARSFSMRNAHGGQRAWISQFRACNFGVFGALGTFFIDGCGDRIASQVLQLCEEHMSA
jgi:hypothetical protein